MWAQNLNGHRALQQTIVASLLSPTSPPLSGKLVEAGSLPLLPEPLSLVLSPLSDPNSGQKQAGSWQNDKENAGVRGGSAKHDWTGQDQGAASCTDGAKRRRIPS